LVWSLIDRTDATLYLKTDVETVQPGEAATVDLFINGSARLRGYEFAVMISGGESGSLTVESIEIDPSRADYVFAGKTAFEATDLTGRRALAAVMTEGVTLGRPFYLGTVYLRASEDAAGRFVVKLDPHGSQLLNPAGEPIPLQPVAAIQLTVP